MLAGGESNRILESYRKGGWYPCATSGGTHSMKSRRDTAVYASLRVSATRAMTSQRIATRAHLINEMGARRDLSPRGSAPRPDRVNRLGAPLPGLGPRPQTLE